MQSRLIRSDQFNEIMTAAKQSHEAGEFMVSALYVDDDDITIMRLNIDQNDLVDYGLHIYEVNIVRRSVGERFYLTNIIDQSRPHAAKISSDHLLMNRVIYQGITSLSKASDVEIDRLNFIIRASWGKGDPDKIEKSALNPEVGIRGFRTIRDEVDQGLFLKPNSGTWESKIFDLELEA